MSSKKKKEEDAVIGEGILTVSNGVVYFNRNLFLCGDAVEITDYSKFFLGDRQAWWDVLRKFFFISKNERIRWVRCNFLKITNIYNQTFAYVDTYERGVEIHPLDSAIKIDTDKLVLKKIKEYLDNNGIEYDDETN